MGEKYCPAGKIECENYFWDSFPGSLGGREKQCPFCHFIDYSIIGFEVCPIPSKQKKIEDKVERAWNIMVSLTPASLPFCYEAFYKACKDAGLKYPKGAIVEKIDDNRYLSANKNDLFKLIEKLISAGFRESSQMVVDNEIFDYFKRAGYSVRIKKIKK